MSNTVSAYHSKSKKEGITVLEDHALPFPLQVPQVQAVPTANDSTDMLVKGEQKQIQRTLTGMP